MSQNKPSTKQLIITTANKLFYQYGIKATSMDAIAEKASVTKKTLYYHFQSKDDLISAYLESRDQPNLIAFQQWFESQEGNIEDKIRAVFQGIVEATSHPKWRGCGFQRTVGELANKPGHPAMQIASQHKKKIEAWLQTVLSTQGIEPAAELAKQLLLLMEGAFAAQLIHRDAEYIHMAGEAAITLIRTASIRMSATSIS